MSMPFFVINIRQVKLGVDTEMFTEVALSEPSIHCQTSKTDLFQLGIQRETYQTILLVAGAERSSSSVTNENYFCTPPIGVWDTFQKRTLVLQNGKQHSEEERKLYQAKSRISVNPIIFQ